jgi:hypothetical protein
MPSGREKALHPRAKATTKLSDVVLEFIHIHLPFCQNCLEILDFFSKLATASASVAVVGALGVLLFPQVLALDFLGDGVRMELLPKTKSSFVS